MDSRRIQRFVKLKERVAEIARAELAEADQRVDRAAKAVESAQRTVDHASRAFGGAVEVHDLELSAQRVREACVEEKKAVEHRSRMESERAEHDERRRTAERELKGLERAHDKASARERVSAEKKETLGMDERTLAKFARLGRAAGEVKR